MVLQKNYIPYFTQHLTNRIKSNAYQKIQHHIFKCPDDGLM